MKSHSFHLAVATALTAASTVLMYFILWQMFPLPVAASAEAIPIDNLFAGHYWVIAFLFSLIIVFLLYSVVVFRRKEGDEGDGEYMHGNTTLEIAWTVAPLGLVVLFAIWGGNLLGELTDDARYQDETIEVTGYQWGWRFKYDGIDDQVDGLELSSMHLLKGNATRLEMQSDDVLHSFWIPEMRVKQDLLPGRDTILRFTPSMTTAEIQAAHADARGIENYQVKVRCAEICGFNHAYMLSDVYVYETDADRIEGILKAAALPDDPVARGEFWYNEMGCVGCHSLDGSEMQGPTWQGIWGREEAVYDFASGATEADAYTVIVDEEYIRSSIYDPNSQIVVGYAANVMPNNFQDQFTQKEADTLNAFGIESDMMSELIEFMKTLEE